MRRTGAVGNVYVWGVVAATMLVVSVQAAEPFPEVRPATRSQAETVLSGGTELPVACLSPMVQSLWRNPAGGPPAVRRALSLVGGTLALPAEHRLETADGIVVRSTGDPGSFDRIPSEDLDGNGLPDTVDAALQGLARGREMLVRRMGFRDPGPLEVVLVRIAGNVEGYVVPPSGNRSRVRVVLDGAGGDRAAVRRAALHQFTHAVALAYPGLSPSWAEALATWTGFGEEGGPRGTTIGLLSRRIQRLGLGLLSEDLSDAAGDALWFAFLREAYGSEAVRRTVEQFVPGRSVSEALELGARRAAGVSLEDAFREFHLWTFLTGSRSDSLHFSFAGSLADAPAAATVSGLPALAVQEGPAVGPWGAVQIVLDPDAASGGMTVRFEGEYPGRWSADLLVTYGAGPPHRVRIPLDRRGAGEVTVPLDGVDQAVLLARNVDRDDRAPRRYTWAAYREKGFPFELGAFEASRAGDGSGNVLVSWDTLSESRLVGFHVLRTEEESGRTVRVNPIRVPALGTSSYLYVDTAARRDTAYVYRVEGVTVEGLTARSDPVRVTPSR